MERLGLQMDGLGTLRLGQPEVQLLLPPACAAAWPGRGRPRVRAGELELNSQLLRIQVPQWHPASHDQLLGLDDPPAQESSVSQALQADSDDSPGPDSVSHTTRRRRATSKSARDRHGAESTLGDRAKATH